MGFFDFFKNKDNSNELNSPREQLINVYKEKGYNKIPVLPEDDAEIERILNSYKGFPAALVPKQYMEFINKKELVWGHIVMLWWIDVVNRKRVPDYFIYQYGIDFEEELKNLIILGLVNQDHKLTQHGQDTLNKHRDIIRKHRAKKLIFPDGTITYHYEDEEETKGITKFISDGDFIEDQRLGKSFEKNKDYSNAIKAYKSAILNSKGTGKIPPNPYYRLAIIYRKLDMLDDEIKILEEGIKNTAYPQAKTTHKKLVDRLHKLRK